MTIRLLSAFSMKQRQLQRALFVSMLLMMFAFSGIAVAASVEPIDSCFGVDHPPFDTQYEGDGYSYLKVGVTMPLENYDEDSAFSGELTGQGKTVTSETLLNAEGQALFEFPLYSYGSYTVKIYDATGTMVFQNDITVDSSEPQCRADTLAVSPPKEVPPVTTDVITETPDTTVTESPADAETPSTSETTTAPPAPAEAEPGGMVYWPLIIVALGGISLFIGIMLLLKSNCIKERNAWLAASEQAAAASAAAKAAEEAAEVLSEEREQLEKELSAIRKIYPSAGRPDGDSSWVEMDGRRITGRDVAMRREAERAAWDKYRSDPNPESASQLEEDWNDTAEPQSLEERRSMDDKAKELEEAIKAAKKAEDQGKQEAKNAKKIEDEKIKAADEARRAYEECMKAALSPPKPTKGDTSGTGGGTAGGPSITDGEDGRPCCKDSDPPQERNRRNLGRVSVPVKLEVTIEGGAAHEGAVAANEISGKLADASRTLGWISKLMDIKGVGETLVRDGVGWSLLGAAAPPATGAVLDIPVPTSPGQLAVDTLSLLGKISSVIIGKVPELQERRLPDCDLSASIENHVFSVECVEIWVCRSGQWVKDRCRFSIRLINKSKGHMPRRTALTWAQAQQEINRYERIYQGQIARALDALASLEAGCK